jgi:segregation and condensation protein A
VVLDLPAILHAVQQVVDAMPQPIIHRVVPRPLDVEGATRRIREMIAAHARLDFRDLVGARPHVADVISTLIALLELARLGEVRLTQAQPLSSFTVTTDESADQTG